LNSIKLDIEGESKMNVDSTDDTEASFSIPLLNYKVEKQLAISVSKRDKEIEKSDRRARIKLLEEEFLKVCKKNS
jgi:hypothetical protein